ncbi:hypothetical protein [Kitasatospora sp. HPMI-4]|uniref:hypothetical protein n=1 Tax=Kitasatospora sp. HPMI-4 TaxID=3448443 RepID=UPI003F1B64BD
MTIMPPDLPLNASGIVSDIYDSIGEAFSVFAEVQSLAGLGIHLAVEVEPGRICATLTVEPRAAAVLPALLAEIDAARPGALPGGRLVVTGSMCQGTVIVRVLIPENWVSAEELAVLTGTVSADPSTLL